MINRIGEKTTLSSAMFEECSFVPILDPRSLVEVENERNDISVNVSSGTPNGPGTFDGREA